MRYVSVGLLGLLGSLLAGCGAGPKPAAKAAAPAATAEEPEIERRPYLETTEPPADALTGLDGTYLRFENPSGTWAKLPSLLGAMPLVGPLKEMTEGRAPGMSAALSAVVDPTQPVEILFGEGRAFAYRVRSPDAVVHGTTGMMLHRVSTGVWDVEGLAAPPTELEEPTDVDSEGAGGEAGYEMEPEEPEASPEPMHCRLMHLPPPVDFRVICADSAEWLRQATPFLVSARRATQSAGKELHVEIGGDRYRKYVDLARHSFESSPSFRKKTAEQERFDKLFSGVALSLFDNERMAFDAQFVDDDVELALDLAYRADSPLAAWLDWAKQERVPEAVRQLPEDSAIRLGIGGLGKPAISALIDELMTSADENLVLSGTDKQDFRAAITGVTPSEGRFVLGMGVEAEAAKAALDSDEVRLADEAGRPLAKRAIERLQAASGEWFAFGVDIAGDRYLQDVKRAIALQSRKSRVRSPDYEKTRRTHSTGMKLSALPPNLPPHSLYYVEQINPNPKFEPTYSEPPALPSQRHWLMLPDGPRAWVVAAPNLATARRVAARVLRPAGSPDRSLAAPDAALQMTLNPWGLEFIDMKVASKAQRDVTRGRLKHLHAAPKRGALALPFSIKALPRQDGAGARLVVQSRLNLQDIFSNAMSLVPTD